MVNPMMLNNFASLFNCEAFGWATDSVVEPAHSYLF